MFKEKDIVSVAGMPGVTGMIFSVTDLGGTFKYEVFLNGELKTFYDNQLEKADSGRQIKCVDAEMLRCMLSAYQINNPSAQNLYSINSARIKFVPYQFRPALKLIKSDEPRILIADSVGVGKTIEAGLIIKELEARKPLTNVLIICPKPLVAERKWELEMARFDENFLPVNSKMLQQIISDADRDGEWPSNRYGKLIIPFSILDDVIYNGKKKRGGINNPGLANLDFQPHFDLVIIDEAHHLRNGNLAKTKAFAYKCCHYFCEHSDAVVMLTATPLQTSDNDLFTLLNLLRPDLVIDSDSFDTMLEPNRYITRCANIVKAGNDDWRISAAEEMERVLKTQWGMSIIARNPVCKEIVATLRKYEVSREEKVKLITDIESLHTLNLMVNRTKRREIQDFCVIRTYTIESQFTPEQENLYYSLIGLNAIALSALHMGKGVSFMISTLRRQAASCIFALAPNIKDIMAKRLEEMIADGIFSDDAPEIKGFDAKEFIEKLGEILVDAEDISGVDPKFDSALKIIKEKQLQPNNKIILFSSFRHTLNYLRKRLLKENLRVGQIDGSIDNELRLELRKRFELDKSDPEAIDIMLFTEVGSEGLDYQFCNTMINYDLPWNPMKIEQRIGRIDRCGQESEVVTIYNLITANTIDAAIYYRCLKRIGIFENSLGECDEILGTIAKKIELIAMNSDLTDSERCFKLEQIADNEVRKAQELNRLEQEEKELFGFELSEFTASNEVKKAENIFLSPANLLNLIKYYLNKRLGEDKYISGDDSDLKQLKSLRLNAASRVILLEGLRNLSDLNGNQKRKWENFLRGNKAFLPLTFDSETAEKNRDAAFITSVHPIIKQSASYFALNNMILHMHLKVNSEEIPAGNYPFAVYAWNYYGQRPGFKLVPVSENEKIMNNLYDYLNNSETISESFEVDESVWNKLEQKHVELWKKADTEHKASCRQIADFRLESLKINLQNRKKSLEKQIDCFLDDSIRTMHIAELKNAVMRYEVKVNEIEKQVTKAAVHTNLLVRGVVTI